MCPRTIEHSIIILPSIRLVAWRTLHSYYNGWHLLRTVQLFAGAIADPNRSQYVRRLLHRCAKTGDEPTLRSTARRWLAVDIDDLPLPLTISITDIAACAQLALLTLPPEFRGSRTIVQATGSHGIKPGARIRLWFWCDRPLEQRELKFWFRDSRVDSSVFQDSQLIYTAAPIFECGRDYLPCRMVQIPGSEMVRVPHATELAPPPKRRPLPSEAFGITRDVMGCGNVALTRAAKRILEAAEGERHNALIKACCGLWPFLRSGAVAECVARQVIQGAVDAAKWPDPIKNKSAIDWAFSHIPEPPLREVHRG